VVNVINAPTAEDLEAEGGGDTAEAAAEGAADEAEESSAEGESE
jgi:large subunit ribosomal protein L25